MGTGFYVNDGGIFVTARHVIEDVMQKRIQTAPLIVLHLHSDTGLFGPLGLDPVLASACKGRACGNICISQHSRVRRRSAHSLGTKRLYWSYVDKFHKISKKSYIDDLIAQNWRNAEILATKFDFVKVAFVLTAVALIPFFLFLLMTSIEHPTQLPMIK